MGIYLNMAKEVLASRAAQTQESEAGSVLAEAAETEMQSDSAELPPIEQSLKGRAVELWRDGNRFFLVADEEDAQEAMGRFSAGRGEVWTPGEIELVTRIGDQAIRDEMAAFKRKLDGALSPAPPVSRARTTAATIRHFERKAGRAR